MDNRDILYEQYWLDFFKQNEIVPFSYLTDMDAGYNQITYEHRFGQAEINKMYDFCLNNELSVFTWLLCCYYINLYKFHGQNGICIATSKFHSTVAKQEALPIYLESPGEVSVKEMLKYTAASVKLAIKHQDIDIGAIEEVHVGYEQSLRYMLLSNMIHENSESFIANYRPDVALLYKKLEDAGSIQFIFNADVVSHDMADKFVSAYATVFNRCLEAPENEWKDIEIIGTEEKKKVLYDFNDTSCYYDKELCIHQVFEKQAADFPYRHLAVDKNRILIYKDFNSGANSIALKLRNLGIGRNDVVALIMERSLTMLMSVMGILKAGGCYLPIDINVPELRVDYILKDAGAKIILTDQILLNKGIPVVQISDINLSSKNCDNPPNISKSTDTAYIIYTSGSTGNPKGVKIAHHSVINRIAWMNKKYPLDDSDVILQKTPYTFDVSVWELFWCFFAGAKVCVAGQDDEKDMGALVRWIRNYQITVIHFVPSVLHIFCSYVNDEKIDPKELSSLRNIFVSGEALGWEHLESLKKIMGRDSKCLLHNLYGPTEACVDVTYYDCEYLKEGSDIPIGKPIDNTQIYILNKEAQPQPIGVPGELYIGGSGLAIGYTDDAETRERFLPNPFRTGEIMYRSGDIARWGNDGNIIYLGRVDSQVKVKGVRIELSEIENHLMTYEAVKNAVVLLIKVAEGREILTAFYVSDRELSFSEIVEYLKSRIPIIMIPSEYYRIPQIPLTNSGKADRKTLVDYHFKMNQKNIILPSSSTEKSVYAIWKEALSLERFSVEDNYYSLNGDSIKAIQIITKLAQREIHLEIGDLYKYPTVRSLANHIDTLCENEQKKCQAGNQLERLYAEIIEDPKQVSCLPEGYEDFYPISDIQLGMIYHTMKQPEQAVYYEQNLYHVKEESFDYRLFCSAMDVMVKKHPILRTVFNVGDFDVPLAIVLKNPQYKILRTNVTGISLEQGIQIAREYLEEQLHKTYNFMSRDHSLPWSMKIFILSNSALVCWDYHHALLDGWSNAAFCTELITIYHEIKNSGTAVFEKSRYSYKDYIVEQMHQIDAPSAALFWKEELKDYKKTNLLSLLGDKKESLSTGTSALKCECNIEKTQGIRNLSEQLRVSIKSICLSAYLYAINMFSYENDIVVGCVEHSRPMVEGSEKLLGCFLNTIPFRYVIDEHTTGKSLILEVSKKINQLSYYNKHSLKRICTYLDIQYTGENPFYDTLFNYVKFYVYQEIQEKDLQEIIYNYERTNTHLDFTITEMPQYLEIRIIALDSLIESGICHKIVEYFQKALDLFLESLDKPLRKRNVMDRSEYDRLVYQYNDTVMAFPEEMTLPELLDRQACITPHAVAIIDKEESVTYQQLSEKINQAARFLAAKLVLPGQPIALYCERSISSIAAIYGILKVGAYYVPIKKSYPVDRVVTILKQIRAEVIITDEPDFYEDNIKTYLLEQLQCDEFKDLASINKAKPEGLAYTIFTSGTMGTPKGVMVTHKSVVNMLSWVNRTFHVSQDSVVLNVTSVSFDLSVYDFFGPLAVGGRVVVVSGADRLQPDRLTDIIIRERVTHWNSVPAMFDRWISHINQVTRSVDNTDLKYIMLSGDWIPVGLPEKTAKILPLAEFYSLGGATEATVWSVSYHVMAPCVRKSIQYGKPIDNTAVYVLDKYGDILAEGALGELYIGGVGVAQGYANDVERTRDAFVLDSYRPELGKTMYRTGDLVRYLPDKNLEILGRIDRQIKLRGYRIELEEIEYHINRYVQGRQVVAVKVHEDEQEYLAAYIVSETNIDIDQLRKYLLTKLPVYMIPTRFKLINSLPLNSNGKIDHQMLIDMMIHEKVAVKENYQAPENDLEEILVNVWQDVLKIEPIGVDDEFLSLNGDSIKVIQIISKVQRYGYKLTAGDIFESQTIRKLAPLLKNLEDISQEPVQGEIPLTPIQRSFFANKWTNYNHYNQSVMLFASNGLQAWAVKEVFEQIVRLHDSLRCRFRLEKGLWKQECTVDGKTLSFREIVLSGIKDGQKEMLEEVNRTHAHLNIGEGPLFCVTLYQMKEGTYLSLVAHHLIIDAFSWRFLLEDFKSGYTSLLNGEILTLNKKTHSIKVWSDYLMKYKETVLNNLKERQYWKNIVSDGKKIEPDYKNVSKSIYSESKFLSITLSQEETQKLLSEVHQAYYTNINDILLAALGKAIQTWKNIRKVTVFLEGHGRELPDGNIDLSRTTGWSTIIYPVLIDMTEESVGNYLIKTKEMMRQIPFHGFNYGIYRYMEPQIDESLTEEKVDILFNYLGDFDGLTSDLSYELIWLNGERMVDHMQCRQYNIEMNSMVVNGQLQMTVAYSDKQYKEQSIKDFLALYKNWLVRIIDFCLSRQGGEKTPSDFGLNDVSVEQLNEIREYVTSLLTDKGGE